MLYDLECKTGLRPKLNLSLAVFGGTSILLSSYTIGSSYMSVSGYGDWAIQGQELVTWFCLFGMVLMAISTLALFSSKSRCAAAAVLIGSGLMVIFGIASLKSADLIRKHGFERLTHEAAPLISAIDTYTEENGLPPESLDLLQIDYPPGHVIKGGELPEFTYIPGRTAKDRYHGNPWVLMLETPTGPFRWDQFLYYPLQNYPSLAHGGWIEKIGEWAYVHE